MNQHKCWTPFRTDLKWQQEKTFMRLLDLPMTLLSLKITFSFERHFSSFVAGRVLRPGEFGRLTRLLTLCFHCFVFVNCNYMCVSLEHNHAICNLLRIKNGTKLKSNAWRTERLMPPEPEPELRPEVRLLPVCGEACCAAVASAKFVPNFVSNGFCNLVSMGGSILFLESRRTESMTRPPTRDTARLDMEECFEAVEWRLRNDNCWLCELTVDSALAFSLLFLFTMFQFL